MNIYATWQIIQSGTNKLTMQVVDWSVRTTIFISHLYISNSCNFSIYVCHKSLRIGSNWSYKVGTQAFHCIGRSSRNIEFVTAAKEKI